MAIDSDHNVGSQNISFCDGDGSHVSAASRIVDSRVKIFLIQY